MHLIKPLALAALLTLVSASAEGADAWRRQVIASGTDPAAAATTAEPEPTSSAASSTQVAPTTSTEEEETPTPSPTRLITTTSTSTRAPTPTTPRPTSAAPTPTTSSARPEPTTPSDTPTTRTTRPAQTTQVAVTSIITESAANGPTTRVVVTTSIISNNDPAPTQDASSSSSRPAASASASASAGGTLSEGAQSESTSGISDSNKRIVIGVCVGVGGALLIGALAAVAWRIWGRKRHGEDGEALGSHDEHIYPSSMDNSPFKSTLDQYHNPAGRLNTASNF